MAKSDTKTPELTGAFALFGKSKDIVVKNWKLFGLLYILPILSALPSLSNKNDSNEVFPFGNEGFMAMGVFAIVLLVVVYIVVAIINQALLYVLEIQTSTGKQPDFAEVWQQTKGKVWNFVGLSLIVGLIIIAGLIAFIVPGIIFIRRYFLAPYYLLDRDLDIGEAMKQSAADSKQYSGYVWSVIGVMFLLTIPSFFPGIGPLVGTILLAFYSVAPALRYQEIKKLS